MKKYIFLVLLAPLFLVAQTPNPPNCDSVFINCCKNNAPKHSELTLIASNKSSVLYNYPGFVLLNGSNDTIAKEIVNYFGIGSSDQKHIMEMRNTISLPFSGRLLLYSGFYKKLECSYSVTFQDTATATRNFALLNQFNLYPNPASNVLRVSWNAGNMGNVHLRMFNATGQVCMDIPVQSSATIDLATLKNSGFYIVQLYDDSDQILASKKLIVNR